MTAAARGGRLLGAALAAIAITIAAPARATPTIWGRARDPGIDQRQALVAQAQALLRRYEDLRRSPLRDRVEEIGALWLREARSLYDRAGAATSSDPFLRLRYAALLERLGEHAEAVKLLQALLRADPPAPAEADAWRLLAINYAHMARHHEEIAAYGRALALEPISRYRANLLANRAEAYMALGDITSAIEGYRGGLALLSAIEMPGYGVTTLWGLAVALDRSGDLDGALQHIQLARAYDRTDQQIHGSSWFYVPPYDEAWYEALGHWASARAAEIPVARDEFYRQAISSWEQYIASAPESDLWLLLAKARLASCEREHAQVAKRARKPAGQRAAP